MSKQPFSGVFLICGLKCHKYVVNSSVIKHARCTLFSQHRYTLDNILIIYRGVIKQVRYKTGSVYFIVFSSINEKCVPASKCNSVLATSFSSPDRFFNSFNHYGQLETLSKLKT